MAGQLRQQPNFSKTRLCADHVAGCCLKGHGCSFAHSKRELRPGCAAKIGRPKEGAESYLKQHIEEQAWSESLCGKSGRKIWCAMGLAPKSSRFASFCIVLRR